MARNSLGMQYACMSSQARENRRRCVPLRPIEDLGHEPPIRFVSKIRFARLRARNDHSVESVVPQLGAVIVKTVQMPLAPLGSGNSAQRAQPDENRGFTRCSVQ